VSGCKGADLSEQMIKVDEIERQYNSTKPESRSTLQSSASATAFHAFKLDSTL